MSMNRVALRLCFPWAQAYSCFISFLDHQSAGWWDFTTLYYYMQIIPCHESSLMHVLHRRTWRYLSLTIFITLNEGLKHPKWAIYKYKQFIYSVVFGLNLFVCTLDEVNPIFRCKKLSSSQNRLISGLNFTPKKLKIHDFFETINTVLDPVNWLDLTSIDLNLTLYSSISMFRGQLSRWPYP